MEPYPYLQRIAHTLPEMDAPEQLNRVLDELEFLHEALDPELQALATQLIDQVTRRLEAIQGGGAGPYGAHRGGAAPDGPGGETAMNETHRPRKHLGQHFLHDPLAIQRIVDAIAPRPGEPLVEIGPGLGAITVPLLERAQGMEVVEVDRDIVPRLEARCREHGHLVVHRADALSFDFRGLAAEGRRLRVVGNLPYNISTPLLFHLLEAAAVIQDMHFLLQKEIVQRLAAPPGGKDYGRLSVMVQYRCQARHLFDVGPGAFRPPPRVDSAFVRLIPFPEPPLRAVDERWLDRLVRLAFEQRRKTLRNALRGHVETYQLIAAGIDPIRRGETLSVEEFVELANLSRPKAAQA